MRAHQIGLCLVLLVAGAEAGSRPRAAVRPPRASRGMRPGAPGTTLHPAHNHHHHLAHAEMQGLPPPPRRSLLVALRTMPLLPAMGATLDQIQYPKLTPKDVKVVAGMTTVWLGYFSLCLL